MRLVHLTIRRQFYSPTLSYILIFHCLNHFLFYFLFFLSLLPNDSFLLTILFCVFLFSRVNALLSPNLHLFSYHQPHSALFCIRVKQYLRCLVVTTNTFSQTRFFFYFHVFMIFMLYLAFPFQCFFLFSVSDSLYSFFVFKVFDKFFHTYSFFY